MLFREVVRGVKNMFLFPAKISQLTLAELVMESVWSSHLTW